MTPLATKTSDWHCSVSFWRNSVGQMISEIEVSSIECRLRLCRNSVSVAHGAIRAQSERTCHRGRALRSRL